MKRNLALVLIIFAIIMILPNTAFATTETTFPETVLEEVPLVDPAEEPSIEIPEELDPDTQLERPLELDDSQEAQSLALLATPSRPTNLNVRYISDDTVSLYWDYTGDSTGIYFKVFRNDKEYTTSTGAVAFISDLDPCVATRLTVRAYNSETSYSSASPTYSAFAVRSLVPAPIESCNNNSDWGTLSLTEGQTILYRASSGGGVLNVYEDIIEGTPVSTWTSSGGGTQAYQTFVAPETKKYYIKKTGNQIFDVRDGASFNTFFEMKPVLGENTNPMHAIAGQDMYVLTGYKVQGFPYIAHIADATSLEVYDKSKNLIASSDSSYVVFETSTFGDVFIKAKVGRSGLQDVRVHRYLPYNTLRAFDAWTNTSEDYVILAKAGEPVYVTANGPADIILSDYDGNKLAESLFLDRNALVYTNFMPSIKYTPSSDGPLIVRTYLDLRKTLAQTIATTETISGFAAGGTISTADGNFYVSPSYVADPIQTSTGAQTISKNLMNVPGHKELNFGLSYNSLSSGYSPAGRRWTHNLDSNLVVGTEGSLSVTLHGQGKNVYTLETPNKYTSSSMTAQGSELLKTADGTYTLHLKDTSMYEFNARGLLTKETDNRGKSLVYSYNNTNQLLQVKDPVSGNYISFTYASSRTGAYITKVIDNSARTVILEIDNSNGNLTSIKDVKSNFTKYTQNSFGQILSGTDSDSNVLFANEFDSIGRVVKQTDATGGVSTFAYTTSGDTLTTVSTDRTGNATTFVHNSDMDILSQTDALGRTTKYTYERNHQPSSVEHPDGTKTLYTHNSAGQITSRTESTGRITTYVYDDKDNVIEEDVTDNQGSTTTKYTYATNNAGVIKIEDAAGLLSTITYDDTGRMATKTNAVGQSISYVYDGWKLAEENSVLGSNAKYRYDSYGRVSEKEDSLGNVTKFTYDHNDNILTETNANGDTTSYTYNVHGDVLTETYPDGYALSYTYNGNGKLTKVSDSAGDLKTITYDGEDRVLTETNAKGSVTTYSYDAVGNLLSATDGNGSRVEYTYDILNRVKTVTSPSGLVTTNTYDGQGRLITKSDSADRISHLTYDHKGNVISSSDPKGNVTSYTYDDRNNLLSTTNADGTILTYNYDVLSNLISETDLSGSITTHEYDDLGRRVKTTDAKDNSTVFAYDTKSRLLSSTLANGATTTCTYDAVGQRTKVENAIGNTLESVYDNMGRVTATIDSTGVEVSKVSYDSKGNVLSSQNALGHTTTYKYDEMSNLTKLTDPKGQLTTNNYDVLSRHTGTVDAAGGTSAQSYNESGQISSYTDPNGNTTSYTYDVAGRLVTTTDATGYTLTHVYDKNDNVVSTTDSEGNATTFEYDSMNRLIKQIDDIGETVITYDTAGRILTTTENGAGQISRTYDELGRPISYTDSRGNTISYVYDSVGNLVELVYPGGKKVDYTYDLLGRISTVLDWLGNTTSYTYDDNGRLTQTNRPNGSVESREYDIAGQLTRLLDTGVNGVISDVSFTYDDAGNVLTEGDKTYEYDDVYRLTNGSGSYTYDATGNLTSVTSSVYNKSITYSPDNRINMYDGQALSTDARGNLLDIPHVSGQSYGAVYDTRNRLVSYMGLTYQYDAEGNRVGTSKTPFSVSGSMDNIDDDTVSVTNSVYTSADNTSGSAYFVNNLFSELPQMLLEEDDAGNTKYYVYGIGLIAEITDHGEIHYYHSDRRGSTIALTDSAGVVTEEFKYSDYGEVLSGDTSVTRFLYNGKYGVQTDSNGLYYMQSRYYSPEIKRFVNRDIVAGSIGSTQSLNRFAYTNGNPISYIDPFGFSRDSDSNFLAWPYHFVSGAVNSAIEGIKGLSSVGSFFNPTSILTDPSGYIQQRLAMANAILHPIDTFNNVKDSVATSFKDNVINGSANDRARYFGSAAFNTATMFTGAGSAGVVSKSSSLMSKAKTQFFKMVPNERGGTGLTPVTIDIWLTEGMSKSQFKRKANALVSLGEQGLLSKAPNPVSRNGSLGKIYKSQVIKNVWNQYSAVNPDFANRAISRVRSMQADHVWELQLKGPDTIDNLKMLDQKTNFDVGTQQIWPQIKNLPDHTPIRINILE